MNVKTYIKPELQVREIRVSENLASNAEWSIVDGKVMTKYGAISALTAAGSDNGVANA